MRRCTYLAQRMKKHPPPLPDAIYWTERDVEMLVALAERADDAPLVAGLCSILGRPLRKSRK